MAQTVQIVPKYSFPYVETVINNNSVVDTTVDTGVDTANKLPFISVFVGPKGPDNKLTNIESLEIFHDVFGYSNHKLYGQPMMMAEALLANGNTNVWCMRITPSDAAYANSVLSLWYKPDVDAKKFRIKFTAKTISNLNSDGEVDEELVEALANRKELNELGSQLDGAAVDGVYTDDEGYIQVPLAVFTSTGRGKYGNDLRWRITLNQEYEKEYGIKLYTFEVIDTSNGSSVVGRYIGSFVTSTAYPEASFINDVIEDSDEETLPLMIHAFEENFEALHAAYVEFCNDMVEADPTLDITVPDMDKFDPLFGKEIANAKVRVTPSQPFITFTPELTDDVDTGADDYVAADYTATETIILNDVTGNILQNGSDGSIDASIDATERQKTIDALYIDAFNGKMDKLILSPRRVPATMLFDAGFSMPVKVALTRLALFRNDCRVMLDVGIMESLTLKDIEKLESDFTAIDALADEFDPFNVWLISVNLHHYYVKESSTGKRVPVTISYYLASQIPSHWESAGYHVPFIFDNATLTGHVKNSLQPSIEAHENDLKEMLYNSRFNYFEATGENIFERGTQNTFDDVNSDLLDENNVNTLMVLKREIEDEARARHSKFTSPTERSEFEEYIKTKYKSYIGKQVKSLAIKYTQNEFEFNRSLVHLYLDVTFPQLNKGTIVELNVNKRSFDEE